MTQWKIAVPDETDQDVRRYLEQSGTGEDLEKFVNEAVQAELLRRTVQEIQDQNSDLSPAQAQALADEAVAWARANRP